MPLKNRWPSRYSTSTHPQLENKENIVIRRGSLFVARVAAFESPPRRKLHIFTISLALCGLHTVFLFTTETLDRPARSTRLKTPSSIYSFRSKGCSNFTGSNIIQVPLISFLCCRRQAYVNNSLSGVSVQTNNKLTTAVSIIKRQVFLLFKAFGQSPI